MKRTYVAAAVLTVLVAGLLFFFLSGRKSDSEQQDEKDKNSQIGSLLDFMTPGSEEKPLQEFNPDNVNKYEIEQANLIRDVIIEKNPVCINEDFKVTVIAKNPNGPDSHLVCRIENQMGNPAILRYTKPGNREFYVIVRDEGKHIDYRKVEVKVNECPDRPVVVISSRLHSLHPETGKFEIMRQTGLSSSCTYEWDFGDGSRVTTDTGYAEHNYAKREQTGLQSNFIVTATVKDSNGKTAVGRASISFPNIHYLSSLMGNPVLPVQYDNFPKVSSSGIEVSAVIKNIFDENVTFDTADIELKPCDSSLSPETKQLRASAVLQSVSIPGKGSSEQQIHLSRSLIPPSTCNVNIQFSGPFPGNKRVMAKLYLNIPPTGKDSMNMQTDKVIEDDEMIQKLNKASKILGKDKPITPADIERLEKEGKL